MRREGRYPDGFGVAPRLSKARNGAAWDIAIFEIAREAAVHTSEPVGSKLHDLCCGSAKAAQKHGEDRPVIDLFQVFNLLGRQEPPDLMQGSFPLDRVLKVSLRRGVTASDHEEDFSGNR
jgi:hypothetical protein